MHEATRKGPKGVDPRPVYDRIMEKVRLSGLPGGCWEFYGSNRGSSEHGIITIGSKADGTRRSAPVYRVMYEVVAGRQVPADLHIDHLCRNPRCVLVSHLEPVPPRLNKERGLKGRLKTHCANGHAWVPENIKVAKSGKKSCKLCWPIYRKRARAKERTKREGERS